MPKEAGVPQKSFLDEVKEELRIEWRAEDRRLERIVKSGKARLEGIVGPGLDFEKEGLAQDLLLAYCRYSYNNALEYFEENFAPEITRLQVEVAIKSYKEPMKDGE